MTASKKYMVETQRSYVCNICGARTDNLGLMREHCEKYCNPKTIKLAESMRGKWLENNQIIMLCTRNIFGDCEGFGTYKGRDSATVYSTIMRIPAVNLRVVSDTRGKETMRKLLVTNVDTMLAGYADMAEKSLSESQPINNIDAQRTEKARDKHSDGKDNKQKKR